MERLAEYNKRKITIYHPKVANTRFMISFPEDQRVIMYGEERESLLRLITDRWNLHAANPEIPGSVNIDEVLESMYGISPNLELRQLQQKAKRRKDPLRYVGNLATIVSRMNPRLVTVGWIIGMSNYPQGKLRFGMQEIPQ